MGLMDHERASHKLTLEAYDRMLPKMKARKEALKDAYNFINKLVEFSARRGDSELRALCVAYLMNKRVED